MLISHFLYFLLVTCTKTQTRDDLGCEPFSESMARLSTVVLTVAKPFIIIASPGYHLGQTYTANATCVRRVLAPNGYQVKFEFINSSYDIETSLYSTCKYDMLELRDGAYPYSPIMGRFCSRTNNAESMISRSNAIYMKFSSDSSIEGTGFQVKFTIIKVASTAISSLLNVCRHSLSGEDGTINIRDSQFTKIALEQLQPMTDDATFDSEDYLVECNIDIDPAIDDVGYILMKIEFHSSNPSSQQLALACPMHRIELHDLGVSSHGKQAQQLPLEPEPLRSLCTPAKNSILVTKTGQATIRVVLLASFLTAVKVENFYIRITYAALAPAERCLNFPANITSEKSTTNPLAAAGSKPRRQINKMGTWCSLTQVSPENVNLLCLHPSLRCNGRNNCPTISAVSVDEAGCDISPSGTNLGGMQLYERDTSFFLPFSLSSDQIIRVVIYGSISLIGLVLIIGLSILAFRRITLFALRTKQRRKDRHEEEIDGVIKVRRREEGCCTAACCDHDDSVDGGSKPILVDNQLYSGNPKVPLKAAPLAAHSYRMTSAYRNQNNSPAFKAINNKSSNQQSKDNNATPTVLLQSNMITNVEKYLPASEHAKIKARFRANQSSSSATSSSHQSPMFTKSSVHDVGGGNNKFKQKGVLKKQGTRYSSGSLMAPPMAESENSNSTVVIDHQQNRLVKSSANVVPIPIWIDGGTAVDQKSPLKSLSAKKLNLFELAKASSSSTKLDQAYLMGIRASPPTPFRSEDTQEDQMLRTESEMNDDLEDEIIQPVLVRLSDFAYQDLLMARSMPPVMPSTMSTSYQQQFSHHHPTPPVMSTSDYVTNQQPLLTSFLSGQSSRRSMASTVIHRPPPSIENPEDSGDSLMVMPPTRANRVGAENFEFLDSNLDLKCSSV